MTNLVTMIQPAGSAFGIFATSVVTATLQSHRALGRRAGRYNLVPIPVREQRLALVRR